MKAKTRGVLIGLGDELRFRRHDGAWSRGRGLDVVGVEFKVGGTAAACAARSHAEVRDLPSERGMNRAVLVQDCREHACDVGRQALGHPVTVSDQELLTRTVPGPRPPPFV